MNLNIITFKDIINAWFPFFYHFMAPIISLVAVVPLTENAHKKEVLE